MKAQYPANSEYSWQIMFVPRTGYYDCFEEFNLFRYFNSDDSTKG